MHFKLFVIVILTGCFTGSMVPLIGPVALGTVPALYLFLPLFLFLAVAALAMVEVFREEQALRALFDTDTKFLELNIKYECLRAFIRRVERSEKVKPQRRQDARKTLYLVDGEVK